MKIRDLVEIASVKTVIELDDVKVNSDAELSGNKVLRELVESFVVTEDIEQNLRIVFTAIGSGSGEGFFLSGTYGSGKTHFLAVLSILLNQPWALDWATAQWPALTSVTAPIRNTSFLTINIPLINFRRDQTLEWIVFSEAESVLARAGYRYGLAETAFFNEAFGKYIVPVHREEIRRFIATRMQQELDWSQLAAMSEADAHRVGVEFLRTCESAIPFHLLPDRAGSLEKIMTAAAELGYAGVVVVLDELSEFMRSKHGTSGLSEDARFLQFLGERSAHLKLWILGALQEAIEKTALVQESVFNKIKDRFPKRLHLTSRHLRSLIDRRLIRKKGQQSYAGIREAYRILHRSFGKLDLGEETFVKGYPVHPETLELLDLNRELFSQRRGAVDFIHQRVKGNNTFGIAGILDADYTTLLTPDSIFDHFEDRIATMPRLVPYYRLYEDKFKREIPRVFTDEEDRAWALILVKILFLLAITPTPQRRTVKELCHSAMIRLLDSALGLSTINYEYVENQLLAKLFREIGNLRVEKSPEPFEDAYFIDLERNIHELFEQRVQEKIEATGLDNPIIFDTAYKKVQHGTIPFASIYQRRESRSMIKWQNTLRSGTVSLGDLRDTTQATYQELARELTQSENDFHLLLATVNDPQRQTEHWLGLISDLPARVFAGVVALIPSAISRSEDRLALARFHALNELLGELSSEGTESASELRVMAESQCVQASPQIRDILVRAYCSGELLYAGNRLHLELGQNQLESFDWFIARVLEKPLAAVYPKHSEFMPETQIHGFMLHDELLTKFIIPGTAPPRSDLRGQAVHSLIETYVRPLGVTKLVGGAYQVDVNPHRCEVAQFILDCFPMGGLDAGLFKNTERLRLKNLIQAIAKSEYGLSPTMAEVLIAAMARQGYLVLLKADRPIALEGIRFPLSNHCDAVQKGLLLEQRERVTLNTLVTSLFRTPIKTFDLTTQEEIWRKLGEFGKDQFPKIAAYQTGLEKITSLEGFRGGNLIQTKSVLRDVYQFLAGIDYQASSYPGLTAVVKSVTDKGLFPSTLADYRKIAEFFSKIVERLPHISRYMHSQLMVIPDSPEYADLQRLQQAVLDAMVIDDELVLGAKGTQLLDGFNAFQTNYIEVYAFEHEQKRRGVPIDTLIKLKNGQELRGVRALSKIRNLGLEHEVNDIVEAMNKAINSVCSQFVGELLTSVPVCACRMRLAEQQGTGEVRDYRGELLGIARKGLKSLGSEPTRSKILKRVSEGNRDEQLREKIRELLNELPGLPDEHLSGRISGVMSEPLIELLNSLLRAEKPIVRKRMSEFTGLVVGKTISIGKLRELFLKWLETDGPKSDDDIIEINKD